MGLARGWLKEVDDYIRTLEEDISTLSKENDRVRDRVWTLRKALKDIRDLDEDGGKAYEIAMRALAMDDE